MPSVDVGYRAVDGGGQLSWRYPLTLSSSVVQFNSFITALAVLRLRSVVAQNWYPQRVQFAHRNPGALDDYKRVFGTGLAFAEPVNCITFRDVNLDRANLSADPRLFKVVKKLGEILLASQVTDLDFKTRVANQIVDLLGVSTPDLKTVGKALGVGGRTIQRRLAAEGTSFETVLHDTRRSVAERLLRETDLALTDIAFTLGFSELSAFTRAATRWHGMPPRQYRMQSRKGC